MFVVSYRFEVHPGENAALEKAWKEVTHLIYRHSGSLGSRLYKTGTTSYLGIAQWPDKATWKNSDVAPFDTQHWRAKMRESCSAIEKVDEMELIHDLWMSQVFPKE